MLYLTIISIVICVWWTLTEKSRTGILCLVPKMTEPLAALQVRIFTVIFFMITSMISIAHLFRGIPTDVMVLVLASVFIAALMVGLLAILHIQGRYKTQYGKDQITREMEKHLVVLRKWMAFPKPIYAHMKVKLLQAPGTNGMCRIEISYSTQSFKDNQFYIPEAGILILWVHYSELYAE